jgi:uncharacterized protein YjbK
MLIREWRRIMAKKTRRGRSQDRKRVAGGQDYEVRYEAKKTGNSKGAVKSALKRAGTSRKKVENGLARRTRAKSSSKRAKEPSRDEAQDVEHRERLLK